MAKAPKSDLFEEQTAMPFGDHLEELRLRLWKALLGLACGLVVGFFLAKTVVNAISKPIRGALEEAGYLPTKDLSGTDPRVVQFEFDREALAAAVGVTLPRDPSADSLTAPTMVTVPVRLPESMARVLRRGNLVGGGAPTGMVIYFKTALITGFVLTSPWIFYQLWCFVAAGLYRHERRYVHLTMPFSLALFLGGAVFCYFLVFPPALEVMLGFYQILDMEPLIEMVDWISFALILPLVFGAGFQLPLVMLLLERLGVFTVADYRSRRKHAILTLAVAAMLLTPPDPYTMLFLMAPMLVLYEGGIWLVCCLRRRSPFGSASSDLPAVLMPLLAEALRRQFGQRGLRSTGQIHVE